MADSVNSPAIYAEVREHRASGRLNRQRAVRLMCKDCSGYNKGEIQKCEIVDCPLWDFRMGKDPYRTKRVMSPEQKEKAVARLQKARESRQASP